MPHNSSQQPVTYARRLTGGDYEYGVTQHGVRVPRGIVDTYQEALAETEKLKASLPKPEKPAYTFEGAGL